MRFAEWITQNYDCRQCTSAQFMYDDMASQSGRWLPVIYRDLDVERPSHWHDEGCILDFTCAMLANAPVVLDFGPGDGWPSLRLAPFVEQVIGVDLSQRRVDECTNNASRLGIRNATFRRIESEFNLPFDDETFDGVTAASSVEQTRDPAGTLRELWRVLKPGGRLRLSYEGLSRYRGQEEQVGWIAQQGSAGAWIDLYDRDPDNERALMVRICTTLNADELSEKLLIPSKGQFSLERLAGSGLDAIEGSIAEIRVCRLTHPGGQSYVDLCPAAGFRSVQGTHNGGDVARRLFASQYRQTQPRTHAELTAYLLPLVESVVGLPAPLDDDPWITAVK